MLLCFCLHTLVLIGSPMAPYREPRHWSTHYAISYAERPQIAGSCTWGRRHSKGTTEPFWPIQVEPCANVQESTAFSTEPSSTSAGGRGHSAPTGRPSAPSGSPSYTWWCADDGKPAEVCHPTYSRVLSENCYILCFRLNTEQRTV